MWTEISRYVSEYTTEKIEIVINLSDLCVESDNVQHKLFSK
jgi:hypothetical protein